MKKSKYVSLNNGVSYLTADEAIDIILRDGLWDMVAECMDDEIREELHCTIVPCTELEFLEAYLEIAKDDIILG